MTRERALQILRGDEKASALDEAEAIMVAADALEAKVENPMLDALRGFLPIDHPEFRGPSRMRIPGQ